MSSLTLHRTFATGAVIISAIVLLLTLYDLRDTRISSNKALSTIFHIGKHTTTIPAYDATKSTSSDKQDSVKIPINEASHAAIKPTSAAEGALPSAVSPPEPVNAFVTFLEADTGTNPVDAPKGQNPDDEDSYFVGVWSYFIHLQYPRH